MVNITKNVRFFYQKSLFTKNSRDSIYCAVRSHDPQVSISNSDIQNDLWVPHITSTLSLHTSSSVFSQESLSRSPSVSGCLLRLTGARGRETALIVSVLQTGGPWAGWAAVSQRSPASLSGLPLTPTARVDPADLFHSWQRPSSPGSPLFLKSSAGPRWDSWGWTFRMRPWCEFWVWNMRLGVCVLKNFNCAFSSNVKWQRVAVYFFEPSDLESGIQCSFFSPLRS